MVSTNTRGESPGIVLTLIANVKELQVEEISLRFTGNICNVSAVVCTSAMFFVLFLSYLDKNPDL